MTRTDQPSAAQDLDQLFASAIGQHRMGQLAQAERIYRQILTADPGHADSLHLLGIITHQRGQHEVAIDLIGQAIARGAPLPQYHYNRGLAFAALGRAAEAAAQFTNAIALKGDYAEAHMSLGDALRDQGLMDEALASYKRAVALKPASAEVHNNIGAILLALGRSEEAIARCEHALSIKPDLFEAHTNLAKLHQGAGRIVQAVGFAARALELRETIEAKTLFVRCVRDTKAAGDVGRIRGLILRGLTEPWGRPDELAAVAISVVMRDDALRAAVSCAAAAWPRQLPARDLLDPTLLSALRDPLLQRLLEVTPVVDIALEQFLTGVRRAMLENALSAAPDDPCDATMLRFFCALARQCFVNEYIFFCSAEEASDARRLRDSLSNALESNAPISPLRPAAVAAYFPLYSLSAAAALEARTWPDGVNELLIQQIREPRTEQQIRASIPRLTAIDDDVSLKVREMYEENPYPRWIKVGPTESPKPLDTFLRSRFPAVPLRDVERKASLDILIAGCGTGRQALEMAQRFVGAKVLAVDLSLASLAYAKRKTQELGLDNVEYGHADILRLGQLDRSFDVIESSGVLHHLDDPWAGWRVLLSLLRPGGFMRVGLYSKLGRPGVIAGRALVAERGYRADTEGIQRFRQELITGNFGPPLGDLITKARDFFTTSELRDLVFHVREHRMTIPQIDGFLRENRLEFLGFELDMQVARRYRARFPDDAAMTNLEHWHAFEAEFPDIFYFTYQFWVRAPQRTNDS
jgi:SAM-dependent methyltransferase/Tfp pilus assembly protein PilF